MLDKLSCIGLEERLITFIDLMFNELDIFVRFLVEFSLNLVRLIHIVFHHVRFFFDID